MSDWIKVFLPLVAITMTSVIGFFLGDFVGELRAGQTIVYSIERSDQEVALRLANIGRVNIENAEFGLRCDDVPNLDKPGTECFIKNQQDGWYSPKTIGPISTRRITPNSSNNSVQLRFTITLASDGRLEIRASSPRPNDVVMFFEPDLAAFDPVRLIHAGGVLGFIVLNYFQVLVWSFATALFAATLVMLIGILGVAIVFFRWLSTMAGISAARTKEVTKK